MLLSATLNLKVKFEIATRNFRSLRKSIVSAVVKLTNSDRRTTSSVASFDMHWRI
jgi:hypothetical protein